MTLSDLKSKLNEKPPDKTNGDNNTHLEPQKASVDEISPMQTGSIRFKGGIMWYTGPERRVKSYRHIDEFPDRLPLDVLREDEKQSRTFFVKPWKRRILNPNTPLLPQRIDTEPSEWTEQQKKWSKQVLTKSDLKQEVGRKVKSHNRLKRLRYIFNTDLRYSLNGMLYYLVPLLINLIFMIANIALFSFKENVIVATVALIPLLASILLFKSKRSRFAKFILFLILLFLCLLSVSIVKSRFPDFWNEVHLPYTVKIFFIYFGFYWFGKYYVIWHIMYVQDLMCDFGNVVKVKCGKPRVGKTSQAVQEVKALALQMWRKLQYDFWLWHSREKEIIARGNIDELLEWFAIKESYLFYTREPEPGKPKGIPCLWSNIGIKDDGGRTAYELTLDHIRGTSRLPLYTVAFADEMGAMLKNDLSFNKKEFYDVSDSFRLGGHYLKWAFIACEQDPKNIYIDCRRVVGANELVKSQEWVCKPTVALGIFNFLKALKIDSLDKGSKRQKRFANFMIKFERFVKSIGFRRQIVSAMGNLETGGEVYVTGEGGERIPLGKNRIRYVASGINRYYNDRAYKQLYPSYFFKKIEGKTFDKLTIDGFDLERATQYVSTTERLSLLRDVLKEKIKELA